MLRHLIRTFVLAATLLGVSAAGGPQRELPEKARAMSDGAKVVRKITRFQRAVWRWQRLMGVPRTPTRKRHLTIRDIDFRVHVLQQWRRRAVRARVRAHNPPNEAAWRCLQRYEGAWTDASDPYWGGLQMDRSFMLSHAPKHLIRRGWANRWSPIEQMWVAERALRAGRGFHPWPHTARICGLI
jgi:hypothetical protein